MTAWRMMSSGSVPGAAMSPAGRWMVEVDDPEPVRQVVAYARVSSHDQKQDLDRQVARIAEWAAASGTRIDRYTREIGSGLNDRRRELAALLADPTVGTIVVEHRDRMARFGVNQLEQALNASKRSLVVIDKGEVADDLVRDMLDLMTCFSAKLYGRRSAANRAKRAIETPQAMTRTFCAVIGDPEADKVLSPYGEVCAKARHWSFKQVHVLGRPVADVKREATRRFGLTARQFNGIRFDLDQAVNGWRGTLEFRIRNLKDSVEATVERIAALGRQMEKAKTDKRRESLHLKQVGKKQRLDVLGGRLAKAEAELKAGQPRVCFGGREHLRNGDVWQWRAKRASRIFLVGSKTEGPYGNQSVQWDGSCLRLRIPDSLGGGFTTLEGVKFRYGQTEMLALLERNKNPVKRVSITWLLFQDDAGRWHAHATVDEPVAELFTDVRHGVVAVDVNVGHLAVTIVDHWGNPTSRLTLAFPESGTDEGKAAVVVGDTVRALCLLARSRGYGIACENLEFSKKKAGLREYGAAHARRLSGWAYAKFFTMLEARCARDGVDLCKVNPAFTSVIGRTKYARGRAMSTHHAAALVIGRRALGYGERLVAMDGAILDGPARNRPRGEWRRWRGVRRLPREGAEAPARTAGSGTGEAWRGGRRRPAADSGPIPGGAITGHVPPPARGAVALASDTSG